MIFFTCGEKYKEKLAVGTRYYNIVIIFKQLFTKFLPYGICFGIVFLKTTRYWGVECREKEESEDKLVEFKYI